jgi:hypothetical protein
MGQAKDVLAPNDRDEKQRHDPAGVLFDPLRRSKIETETIVYNHLNQPRELVKAQAVTSLFA